MCFSSVGFLQLLSEWLFLPCVQVGGLAHRMRVWSGWQYFST